MKIKAIHKTTVIDYPGKIACTLFIWGCNFKCGFCHNPELVIKDDLPDISQEEILSFLEKRKKYLDAVCITGGEPLLSLDLDFLKKIKEMGYLIKVDTNGSLPEKLKELVNSGLVDYIAMDIKSSNENYSNVARVSANIEEVEESIRIVSKFPNHEFRITIVEDLHDHETMVEIMQWLDSIICDKIKNFYLQGFKNHGKLIDESFYQMRDTSEQHLLELKKIAEPFCERVEIRV
ncbi:MAG: anaerobic ribonucleoside-triphosphate reductase activating protein [Candidatus Pacearchaeota archaeon]|jgi:pyruvate formate lyase activating enzyme